MVMGLRVFYKSIIPLVAEELLSFYGELSTKDLGKKNPPFSDLIIQLTSVKDTWHMFSEELLNF
jgi:hypothetical protein